MRALRNARQKTAREIGIRAVMLTRNLTLRALARECGISGSLIGMILAGKRRSAVAEAKISNLLGCDVSPYKNPGRGRPPTRSAR